tara:strand:- start:137 stop:346 length:210 start_codon:yes stop_codon:yes gene_type:complete
MNERLRELAIGAGIISAEYNGFDQTRLSMSQQKFAELIVEGCAKIADRPHPLIGTQIGNQIRTHFGVKE